MAIPLVQIPLGGDMFDAEIMATPLGGDMFDDKTMAPPLVKLPLGGDMFEELDIDSSSTTDKLASQTLPTSSSATKLIETKSWSGRVFEDTHTDAEQSMSNEEAYILHLFADSKRNIEIELNNTEMSFTKRRFVEMCSKLSYAQLMQILFIAYGLHANVDWIRPSAGVYDVVPVREITEYIKEISPSPHIHKYLKGPGYSQIRRRIQFIYALKEAFGIILIDKMTETVRYYAQTKYEIRLFDEFSFRCSYNYKTTNYNARKYFRMVKRQIINGTFDVGSFFIGTRISS